MILPQTIEIIFLLGGLALGLFVHKTWFAQRFSGEDLEELGRAISTLFQLYAEVRMIKANLDTLATVSDNTARFEAVRQYALRKFVRKDEFFRQEIHLARIAVAKHVPLALYQLEKVLKLYEYFQNAKFEEYTQDRGTYILRLTGFGKSFHKNQLLVAYIIRDLAKKHSFQTWLQVNYEFFKLSRSTSFRQVRKSKPYRHLQKVYQSIVPEEEDHSDTSSF